MTEISPFKESFISPDKPKGNSIMWKVLTILGLMLGLLIPINMISGLVFERQANKKQVVLEIAQNWAGKQAVIGPILAVPYKTFTREDGNVLETQNIAYLLPEQYKVKSQLQPEVRHRGIYQSVVYASQLSSQGYFDLKSIQDLHIPSGNFLWSQAFLIIGVQEPKGMTQRPQLIWQGKEIEMLPGVHDASLPGGNGLHALTPLNTAQGQIPFKLNLGLKGSETLHLAPIGKQSVIEMFSPWNSPSFLGHIPDKSKISADGFTATWNIPYFAREYSQVFTEENAFPKKLTASAVGVQLLTPVDSYRQTERAIKYGILFLVLTFSTYFLFETICRHRLHPFQYLLIGLAISLFYLLLLAVSEITVFGLAYALASCGIISIITLYSKAILGNVRKNAPYLIGGFLVMLYSYLYILLQMEDWSLLFGALGLFAILAVAMYITRNIDWYTEQSVRP